MFSGINDGNYIMNEYFQFLEKIVPSYVRKFEAYVPCKPESVLKELFGFEHLLRLNSNENVLGPSPRALEAVRSLDPGSAAIYPSGDSYLLRQSLAGKTGLTSDSFIVGNGANEVISFVIKAFCKSGDNIITADKTFAVYEWTATFSGVEARLTPLVNHGFDPQSLLDKIDRRTKIIFVCNPNNPTGSYWTKSVLRRFLDDVDAKVVVVIDEAYAEFVESSEFPNSLDLISEYPNLVVFRTFSKMHALAALRVGYLAGDPELVSIIKRVAICYSVNSLGQAAAAAALTDADFQINRTREMVRKAKDYILGELDRLDLPYISGVGNFIMIRTPISDTFLYRLLMQKGIMVRTLTTFRFPNYIRLTFARLPEMKTFIRALEQVLLQSTNIA